jgi:hypothetical protein
MNIVHLRQEEANKTEKLTTVMVAFTDIAVLFSPSETCLDFGRTSMSSGWLHRQ